MSEELAFLCEDSDVEACDEHEDSLVVVVASDSDVMKPAVVAEGDCAALVDAVLTDPNSA